MGRASRRKGGNRIAAGPRSRTRRVPWALALALVLAAGGAGAGLYLALRSGPEAGRSVTLPGGGTVRTPRPAPVPGIEKNFVEPPEPAPDFDLTTLDGEPFSLSSQRGRPVVLFFMAGWCTTCLPEAEALGRIHAEFADLGVRVLAVSVDPADSPGQIRAFAEAAGSPGYPFAHDEAGEVARAYEVLALDTTVMIDAQGRVVYRDSYVSPYEHLRAGVERALE